MRLGVAAVQVDGHGASLETAPGAASRVRARPIRRPALGELRTGATADVVVLDDSVQVQRTLVGGEEVWPRG